jgi:hypothetical protein
VLVNKAVKQITENGNESGIGGRIVVRTDERVEFRFFGETLADPLDNIGVNGGVGVKEQEHIACRGGGSAISGKRGAAALIVPHTENAEGFGNPGGIVVGGIVHDNALSIEKTRGE